MGSLSAPHNQMHQVGGCHWKKYSEDTQLRVRDFDRHALKNTHRAAVILCMGLCHANNTYHVFFNCNLRVLNKLHAAHLKKIINEDIYMHLPECKGKKSLRFATY